MQKLRILFTDTTYFSEVNHTTIIVHSSASMYTDNLNRMWSVWTVDKYGENEYKEFDTKREAMEYANYLGGIK